MSYGSFQFIQSACILLKQTVWCDSKSAALQLGKSGSKLLLSHEAHWMALYKWPSHNLPYTRGGQIEALHKFINYNFHQHCQHGQWSGQMGTVVRDPLASPRLVTTDLGYVFFEMVMRPRTSTMGGVLLFVKFTFGGSMPEPDGWGGAVTVESWWRKRVRLAEIIVGSQERFCHKPSQGNCLEFEIVTQKWAGRKKP